MLIFGIDPSFTCGYGLVDVGARVRLLRAGCFEATPIDGDDDQRIRKIVHCCRIEYAKLIHAYPVRIWIGCEVPTTRNALVPFKRKSGGTGQRQLTSAQQWELIGRLRAWMADHESEITVTPDEAKRAVGAKPRSGKEPVVAAVRRLCDGAEPIFASLTKQAHREAAADAIAVALATAAKIRLAQLTQK